MRNTVSSGDKTPKIASEVSSAHSPCRQPALYLSSLAISAAINLQLLLARNPSIKSSAEICGEDVSNKKIWPFIKKKNKQCPSLQTFLFPTKSTKTNPGCVVWTWEQLWKPSVGFLPHREGFALQLLQGLEALGVCCLLCLISAICCRPPWGSGFLPGQLLLSQKQMFSIIPFIPG